VEQKAAEALDVQALQKTMAKGARVNLVLSRGKK